ncbi:MAG: hypothetical protein RI885_2314 [Actinomycetota bacterium]
MTELGRASARISVPVPDRDDVSVTLAWGAATDVGLRRRHNEDSYLAESPVFVVADGMGGHAAGDIASAAVVTRLQESLRDAFADQRSIADGLRAATADITLAEDLDELGVGTTVTGIALTLQNGDPYWAVFNIGDSRVYQFEDGTLTQVTIDHSVVQELVDAGLIRAEDAEFHPDSNVITRAVGFNAEPIADFWMLPARTGLRLLICSDGLTREVDSGSLRHYLGLGSSPQDTASALIAAALRGGGRDNITAVVVDVIEGVDHEASDSHDELDTTVPRGRAASG